MYILSVTILSAIFIFPLWYNYNQYKKSKIGKTVDIKAVLNGSSEEKRNR